MEAESSPSGATSHQTPAISGWRKVGSYGLGSLSRSCSSTRDNPIMCKIVRTHVLARAHTHSYTCTYTHTHGCIFCAHTYSHTHTHDHIFSTTGLICNSNTHVICMRAHMHMSAHINPWRRGKSSECKGLTSLTAEGQTQILDL